MIGRRTVAILTCLKATGGSCSNGSAYNTTVLNRKSKRMSVTMTTRELNIRRVVFTAAAITELLYDFDAPSCFLPTNAATRVEGFYAHPQRQIEENVRDIEYGDDLFPSHHQVEAVTGCDAAHHLTEEGEKFWELLNLENLKTYTLGLVITAIRLK